MTFSTFFPLNINPLLSILNFPMSHKLGTCYLLSFPFCTQPPSEFPQLPDESRLLAPFVPGHPFALGAAS